jgi:hypothetical protein
MSSTHSDSNSKKVYRQPEKPTIQDVIAAWKEIETKVEEMFEKVHVYDVTLLSTNKIMTATRANLEKVKFTVWEKLVKTVTPGQSSPEDEKRIAIIEHYEKTIKEQETQRLTTRDDVLTLVKEARSLVNNATLMANSWAQTVDGYAAQDLLAHSITAEELIHIQAIAAAVCPKYRSIKRIVNCILNQIIDILSRPTPETIGKYNIDKSDLHLHWTYEYNRLWSDWCQGHYYCCEIERHIGPHTNEEIKNTISTFITTLEQVTRFFSSPLPGKPDTQTA